ncbi:putative quinol monooxygenase [Ottowia sp.]|uniref:putative quinol monooxygenase n=1 Tax=Ottowia sp. TaxID=1898956 RepID=UPI003A84870C
MTWSRFLTTTMFTAAVLTAAFIASTTPVAAQQSAAPLASAVPVVRLFELGIASGQTEAFDVAGRANISASIQQEPGTRAMYAVTQPGDAQRAYVLEVYTDAAALAAHTASVHFKQFLADTQSAITTKRLIEVQPQFVREQPAPLAVTGPTRAPLVRMARISVHPQYVADYRRIVMWEMQRTMDVEPGVLAMIAVTLKGQPRQWVFFEVYADQAASDAHRQTAHFRAYVDQTRDMVAARELIDLRPSTLMNKGGLAFSADGAPSQSSE